MYCTEIHHLHFMFIESTLLYCTEIHYLHFMFIESTCIVLKYITLADTTIGNNTQ